MCGRFTLHTSREVLARRFAVTLDALPAWPPRYNIAPSNEVLVVRERQGVRAAQRMRWGLVPHWAEGMDKLPSMINARIETLSERPAFRQAVRSRRCLILADGFYEWQAKGSNGRAPRTPYYIGLASGEPYAMAGLWETWRPADEPSAPPLVSCAIVTVNARAAIAGIHPRMPLILPPALEPLWLAERADPAALLARLEPVASSELRAHPVSFEVNAVANDDARLIQPAVDPRPSLF